MFISLMMFQTIILKIRKQLLIATAFFAALLFAVLPARAQFDTDSGPAARSNTAGRAEDVIPFLNQTIVWSRDVSAEQQLINEPSDALFLSDSRQIADQVVRLAFDYARAKAQAMANRTDSAPGGQNQPAPSQYQRLIDSANKSDQQVKSLQLELDGFHQQLLTATGRKRVTLQAVIAETEGELELFQTRRDTLRNMLQFATGTAASGLGSGSLLSQVEELARTVPSSSGNGNGSGNSSGKDPAETNSRNNTSSSPAIAALRERKEAPNGILALATDLFSLRRKLHALNDNLRRTDLLVQTSSGLRAPLVAKIRELTQKGDDVAGQPDSQDPAVLAQQKKDLDALTTQFKQISASLLPLGKQSILLDIYKRTTSNWRDAVESEYQAELKGLLIRLAGLALILGVVLGISELWRRATFRYITDTRRRYQFLLIRRIVLWFLIAIIVATAFASELGAVTTFAGLLTAGIAVALQNVILSIAGYFFLIGKYGLRVGDRVQIAGVTGDVVDIGLVRMQLMEITDGPAPLPTGRVVAFSNAVVFQANAGMFKQIPGTNFLWHEITLTLDPKSNYRQVEQRIMEAVNKIFTEYREKIETQRRNVENSLNSTVAAFAPESRLHLTQTSLEIVVRYPVELGNAGEIDNRVTREILDAMERDPDLRNQVSGGPTIKAEELPAGPAKK
ncbi:MAG TPA: mechanosensitive ion channel family protein [Candidatus Angelobacter sp.]|nr:mechanosensitive ion channel family protein [Candidatus Angelobacter sp.]